MRVHLVGKTITSYNLVPMDKPFVRGDRIIHLKDENW